MANPLTWIEAPERSLRPNRSLDVVPVHDVSNDHFVGFVFQPDPCGFPKALPQDCYIQYGPAAGTAKTFDDPGTEVVTDVFGVYQGIECFLNGGIPEFRAVAERVLEAGEHRIVDGRIAGLLAGATTTTPATASSIEGAFAVLEQYLSLDLPAQGYLLMGALAATFAASKNLLIRNLDGTLETYLGTPVVVLTEPSAAGFIYASGPINVWRGPVVTTDTEEVTKNKGRAIAERLYSLTIECGAWKIGWTAPAGGQTSEPEPDVDLTINLGSIPSSPIPDGTDATIIAQTNKSPEGEVFLWYRVNGGVVTLAGEMTETGSHEFVWNVDGASTTSGDSVELWAQSDEGGTTVESNHIIIEVT